MTERKVIKREALYEQVWEKPMIHLAKEYGISDVGLKKICKKMEIPTPGLGHWTRIECGQKVPKKPLPKLSKNGVEETTISPVYSEAQKQPQISDEQKSKVDAALEEISKDESSHPFIENSRKSFEAAGKDEREILKPKAKRAMDMQISRGSIERAFSALDRIIKGIEALGYEAILKTEKNPKLKFLINGEELGVSIEEKISRSRHVVTEAERRSSSWHWKMYDYEPTGKLTVQIHGNLPYGMRTSWSDGKVQRVEKLTGKILHALIDAAAAQKQKIIDDERREREWAEERRRAEEARELRRKEKQRQKHLEKLAGQYAEAQKVQNFVEALEQNLELMKSLEVQGMEFEKWLEWAKSYADQIDPMKYQHWWDIEKQVPLWEIRDSYY